MKQRLQLALRVAQTVQGAEDQPAERLALEGGAVGYLDLGHFPYQFVEGQINQAWRHEQQLELVVVTLACNHAPSFE